MGMTVLSLVSKVFSLGVGGGGVARKEIRVQLFKPKKQEYKPFSISAVSLGFMLLEIS